MHRWPAAAGHVLAAVSLAALASGSAAQDATTPGPAPSDEAAPAPVEPDRDPPGTIVVIGDRAIIASLQDLPVERTYDEDEVASYAAGSVGEVLDALAVENGDEEPELLVNGRPVTDRGDIADLPPEAIARIETLPKGAAQRIGGAAGQRAYNVVLKRTVRSATLTASDEFATAGGWNNANGQVQLTRIQGQNRINLSLRGGYSGYLLESERPGSALVDSYPYASPGNLQPGPGATEIDPALSALAGYPVLLAPIGGAVTPSLSALAAAAGTANPTAQSGARTLRGPSRPLDVSLSGNRELTERLSLSFSARAGWTSSRTLSGLPRTRLLVPASNTFSPFGNSVYLAIEDPARRLHGRFDGDNQALSATLNALLGKWRASLTARYERRAYESRYESSGTLPVLTATADPFDPALAASIPVVVRQSTSSTDRESLIAEADGPLVDLWAGPLVARLVVGAEWTQYAGSSDSGDRAFDQHILQAGAGITLPLTAREGAFLPGLGDSELALDYGIKDLGRFGTLESRSIAFNWQPVTWLRVNARSTRQQDAIGVELQSAPQTVVDAVPYFDPLTGDTVEVTTVYGGVAGLLPTERRRQAIGFTMNPPGKEKFQLDAEYAVDDTRNVLGALPDASPAVVAAFPDRFVRDGSGMLVLVDTRSVNFARQRSETARIGLRYTLPIGAPPPPPARGQRRTPQARLQVAMSHSELLSSTTLIRDGLPVIDLLQGGAIGIGGSQPRSTTRASFTLSRGSSGGRLTFQRRGGAKLVYGTAAAPDLIEFAPLATLDFNAYVDLRDLFATSDLAKGTRLSLTVDNLFDRRQRIATAAGFTPRAFQPLRRDPVGRTIALELRKTF